MTLVIPAGVYQRLRAHAEAAYPDEACGILIGAPAGGGARMVADALPAPNACPAGARRRRFLILPDDVAGAGRQAGRRGLEIVGFFHSHPDQPARPSTADDEAALPGLSCLIVPVAGGQAEAGRAWAARDGRPGFDEEPLAIESI